MFMVTWLASDKTGFKPRNSLAPENMPLIAKLYNTEIES